MILFYNGDNVASVVESEYWNAFWNIDERTEIEFLYDDYDVTDQIYEFLKESNLDYCDDSDDEAIAKILEEKLCENHFKGYEFLEKSIQKIIDKVMLGILNKYPEIVEEYGEYADEMPEISTVQDLKEYIKPLKVFIHEDGNIGIGFDCEWEEEHGLGILYSKDDGVIVVGDFSEAF